MGRSALSFCSDADMSLLCSTSIDGVAEPRIVDDRPFINNHITFERLL